MSQEPLIYNQAAARISIYRRFDDGYERPSGQDIKTEIAKAGLSNQQAAALLGLKSTRELRKLLSEEKRISYAMWRLLCIYSESVIAETKNLTQ